MVASIIESNASETCPYHVYDFTPQFADDQYEDCFVWTLFQVTNPNGDVEVMGIM